MSNWIKKILIETDKTKLYNILNNLLSNAFKFTNNGLVKFGYIIAPNEIEFFVKETGVGISEKSLETIFNRFEQEEKVLSANSNFELIHAFNGQIAVDLFAENPNIDLILMDIKMPVMNGYEATKKMKSKNPDIPIIAVTAYSAPTDKKLALDSGCDDFISKPFEKKKLLDLINKYIK